MDCRFCQMEAKRGDRAFGAARTSVSCPAPAGATRCITCFLCDEFNAQRAREIGLVQEVVPAGQQVARAMEDRRDHCAQRGRLASRSPRKAALKYVEGGEAAAHRLYSRDPRPRPELGPMARARAFSPSSKRRAAVFQGR